MISNIHYIELWVNDQLIELESQSSLNLRINNVLFNPTKTSTTQAEFSYSFDIPSTQVNDKIFDYANVLAKTNKFHTRYPTQVYADGELIFNGSLTIQKYSAKTKKYTCNLVNIKVNTLEDIFGEAVLTDVHWDVDFSGATTINSVNFDYSKQYFFPLISYGVFQKRWESKDEVAATYTPKHQIDKYNKWWIESFYPSLNVMEEMKKCFEWKGYTVNGSAFSDPNIKYVYASCNLADDQMPIYNLGNPLFGELKLDVTWNNYQSINETVGGFGSDRRTFSNGTGGLPQDLEFPYEKVTGAVNSTSPNTTEYNFSTIQFWNMMDSTNNSAATVSITNQTYMYDPTEMTVVIPADGFYKIILTASATLSGGSNVQFNADQWTTTFKQGDEFKKREIQLKSGFKRQTPLEIQLIRNYDSNIELIKGTKNVEYATGNPNDQDYFYSGGTYTSATYTNKSEWLTDFPHQDLYAAKAPTNTEGLLVTTSSLKGGWVQGSGGGGTFGSSSMVTRSFGDNRRGGNTNNDSSATYNGTSQVNGYGYMHKNGYPMPYDQAVSPAFICGFSSLGDGTVSVMRNGNSWSKMCTIENKLFANVRGMDYVEITPSATTTTSTEYCMNIYRNSPLNTISVTDSTMNGSVACCVYLRKNDVLELVAVQRDYDGQKYACSAQCHLEISAISPREYTALLADDEFNYYSDTEFPKQLNLFNFTNKETKISDWISNIQQAFNLEIITSGDNVEINTNKGIRKDITYAIDIDDRVSSDEAEAEYISYPKEMSVQYSINTDEYGFWLTVPSDKHNLEDWAKYGDSGFTVIQLNDDSYETSTQNTTVPFSYTYYDEFTFKDVNQSGEETGWQTTISIPTISKYDYMAEGYNYEESEKYDGYSLTQRFWYRDQPSQEYVYLSDHLKEQVWLTYTSNFWNDFNLSYKDTEKSIATEYFNIHPMLASNYVNVDAYLTPEEYKSIKGGALIHYDSDLYYCSEISGYDPSGANLTTLKLIKKI